MLNKIKCYVTHLKLFVNKHQQFDAITITIISIKAGQMPA